jgi:hypothetical protein
MVESLPVAFESLKIHTCQGLTHNSCFDAVRWAWYTFSVAGLEYYWQKAVLCHVGFRKLTKPGRVPAQSVLSP